MSETEEAFGGDALTVNGYLGSDGINPLLTICEEKDKGIFVLVKTSNPSSGELQNLEFRGDETVYLHMGRMCEDWGKNVVGKYGYSGVGAVVDGARQLQLQVGFHPVVGIFIDGEEETALDFFDGRKRGVAELRLVRI